MCPYVDLVQALSLCSDSKKTLKVKIVQSPYNNAMLIRYYVMCYSNFHSLHRIVPQEKYKDVKAKHMQHSRILHN